MAKGYKKFKILQKQYFFYILITYFKVIHEFLLQCNNNAINF